MITVISERAPTSKDKLPKPKELKGVKPLFSVKWGGITTCQVFVKGVDVWINHHDWCSVSVYGAKAKSNRHYGYSDAFTAPTIKGDAWIRLTGLLSMRPVEALRMVTAETELNGNTSFCRGDARMFEDIVTKLYKEGVYDKAH